MKRSYLFIALLLILGSVILISEYRRSFQTINEAIYDRADSTPFMQIEQIIGGSEYGRNAFYFFLNKEDKVVGVRLYKGIFGWKFGGASTGTGLEIDKPHKLSMASTGSSNESNKFYFGLTSVENIGSIIINDTNHATLINLEESIDGNKNIPNTYLWYGYLIDETSNFVVKIYDEQNEIIYSQ